MASNNAMSSKHADKRYKKDRGTMIYTPTDAQEATGKLHEKVFKFFESLYWMYYIHLPYYLMTSFDSFCLHVFFLVVFTLSLFGLLKWVISLYWAAVGYMSPAVALQ
ncbi:AaceriAGR026Cp [[Ashbya] aceris (nom. inval.)]|nr:AaceriAGR026Cp [[Ashbya] aceris (nom. inval.)]